MNKFKRAVAITSKILIAVAVLLLAIMIGMAITSKSDEIVLFDMFGIVCIVAFAALAVVYVMMFIMHLVKVIKDGSYEGILKTFVSIPIILLIIIICSKVNNSDDFKLSTGIALAAIISLGDFAQEFWKDVKEISQKSEGKEE